MGTQTRQAGNPTVMGQLVLCVSSWGGAYALYPMAMNGKDLAGMGDVAGFVVLLLLLLGVASGKGLLGAVDKAIDRRRWHGRVLEASDRQGNARLGTQTDAKSGGFLTGFGFICGRISGKLFTIASEKSWIITGPAGSGKSLWLLANLVASRHRIKTKKGYKEVLPGLVVLDISGEIYCSVHRWLTEKLSYRIVVLCAEAERMSEELGVEITSTQSNPAAFMTNSQNPKDDAEMLAMFIHPGTPKGKAAGATEHFDEIARLVLTTWILWLLSKYGVVTLTDLRRCVMSTQDEQAAVIDEILQGNDAGDGPIGNALRENASTIQLLMTNPSDEYSGAMTTCARSVRLYSAGTNMGTQVSENRADWSDLKNPETPTAFFIMTPVERLDTYGPWTSLTIASGIEQLARHKNNHPVHLHLDEIGNIYLPNLMKLISVYRKFSLVTILYLQSMRAQLARWYGDDAATEIIGNCETLQGFSMRNLSDLKEISELIGKETVRDASETLRVDPGGSPNVSYSGSYRGESVLSADKIRRLPTDKTLVMHGNAPPFVLNVVNPLHEAWLQERLDENPYYRE